MFSVGRAVLILSVCCSLSSCYRTIELPGPVFTSTCPLGDKAVRFVAHRGPLRDSPPWKPGDELPLSMEEAVHLAKADVGCYVENPGAWEVRRINLFRDLQGRPPHDKWFYIIDLSDGWDNLMIPVFFNREVAKGSIDGKLVSAAPNGPEGSQTRKDESQDG